MKLNKVQFDGILLSDLACMLEDTLNLSATDIEELVTTSDELCPSDINRCEYVVLYWWQLRDHFVHVNSDEYLLLAMDKIQNDQNIDRDTLIFCQV